MSAKPMLVLGMMSGTSADGIDAALVEISGAPPRLTTAFRGHVKRPFPAALRREILRAAEQRLMTPGELSQLDARLGRCYAEAALSACRALGTRPERLDLIGNHGQTVFHQGRPVAFLGAPTASTLQIGDPSVIAARTGITTVGDFRPADLALGGQGAPLVPFADYALYRHPRFGRVSLNIGGIANVTLIPAGARSSEVLAFDTGPGNMLIDALVRRATRGRAEFDRDGRLARKGTLNRPLLAALRRDPYYRLRPPKSTGREYFGARYVDKLLGLGRRHGAGAHDLIRTATLLTPLSIADALGRFVLPKADVRQVIVSGGGARNPLIMGGLAALLAPIEVLPSSVLGVPVDAKEAIAFAILAYESVHRRASNLPSATGARGPAVLGKVCYAPPR